jgi:hypothetical protein
MQLIYEYPDGTKDDFSFLKQNGKVIYSHQIKDPFDNNAKIYGVYCIIKNRRGEFLEPLNMATIEQMKSAAKLKNVWDKWFSEMVMKSVIKRACKRHFKDITQNMDNIDNENYDLEKSVDFDEVIKKKITESTTFAELTKIYKAENKTISDKVNFMKLLGDRKEELLALLPEITKKDHEKAIKMLQSGKTIKELLLIWKIDEETQQTLASDAL